MPARGLPSKGGDAAVVLLKTFRTVSFYIEPKLIDIGEANQEYAAPAGASL